MLENLNISPDLGLLGTNLGHKIVFGGFSSILSKVAILRNIKEN